MMFAQPAFGIIGKLLLLMVEMKISYATIMSWRRRARQSLRSGPEFVREVRDGFLVLRRRCQDAEAVLEQLLPYPDGAYNHADILKPGSRSHLGVVEFAGKHYVLKRYNCRGTSYRLLNSVRRSRAVRTWLVGWEYLVRGIPVPLPLVCLEERKLRMLGRSYVLMEWMQPAKTLRESWKLSSLQEREDLIEFFGVFLGQMHRSGMIHGDLKWDNILVDTERDPKSVCLVDLDGSRALKKPSLRASRMDLQRFLQDLAREGGHEEARKKLMHLWRKSFLCER